MTQTAPREHGSARKTTTGPSVTAIIPTLAEASRRASILRAVDSLRAAALRVELAVVAVVNGSRFEPEIVADLRSRGVRIVQIAQGSLPAALLEGRRAVQSSYFCFLDDDDEYLPHAIDKRVEVLDNDPAAAVVASNGYKRHGDLEEIVFDWLSEVPLRPLEVLFRENWLPSCGGLYRTAAVSVDFFEHAQQYLEWTWLAFRLVQSGKKIAVLDEPTFRIHESAASLSKTPSYVASHITLYERMLRESIPPDLQNLIRRRLGIALSRQSVALLQSDLKGAWHFHLRSLACRGGWRYGSQTLRLAIASLAQLRSRRIR